MKALIRSVTVLSIIAVVISGPLQAKEYGKTTLKSILLDASEYKNDRVVYEAVYNGFTTNAPYFLDKNGFKEGKDVVISAGGPQFLIIAERDDIDDVLLKLKRGSVIKVSGKVRKMKREPKYGINTGHYLELEGLELVREPAAEIVKDQLTKNKKGRKLVLD